MVWTSVWDGHGQVQTHSVVVRRSAWFGQDIVTIIHSVVVRRSVDWIWSGIHQSGMCDSQLVSHFKFVIYSYFY